jgi:transposase InsO family protein
MLMLLAIIKFVQYAIQKTLFGLSAPVFRRYSHKKLHHDDPKSHLYSKQKPEWIKQEIIRLKALMPQAGCRSISDICNRRFAASRNITVGKTYVHQVLQQHDYDIQILRRKLKHVQPKAVPRNHIWGLDLTGKTDTRKNLHALLGILDHGSRALLHLQALHNKTSQTLITCIKEVIRTHGKPKIIRTDSGRVAAQQRGTHRRTPCGCNESIFSSTIFRRGLKRLGIRHQRTDPGCPWQNGMIERLFGTLKNKLDQWTVQNFAQLNRDLSTFSYWYNCVRPHQNLNGKTPAEAWRGIDPYEKPFKQERWFEAWDGLLVGYELKH